MSAGAPWLMLAALAAVIGLVLLARRALALLPPGFAPRSMPVRGGALALEQVLALDTRRRLVLVRCGERRLLLLTGGTRDLALGWLDAPGAPPP